MDWKFLLGTIVGLIGLALGIGSAYDEQFREHYRRKADTLGIDHKHISSQLYQLKPLIEACRELNKSNNPKQLIGNLKADVARDKAASFHMRGGGPFKTMLELEREMGST